MAKSKDKSWGFAALALLVFVVGAVSSLWAAPGGDYWWHITMGRFADTFVAVPTHNLLLYTQPIDAPARSVGWLSQWWLFELHQAGGVLAAHYARSILLVLIGVASGLYALWRREFRSEAIFPTLLAVVTLSMPFATLGPGLFGAAFAALSIVAAFAVHRGQAPRGFVALLVLLPAVWVHVDTSFWVPGMLAFAFGFLGRDSTLSRRAWCIVGLASIGVSLVNPGFLAPWESLAFSIAAPDGVLSPDDIVASLVAISGALVVSAYAARAREPDAASFFVLALVLGWGFFVDPVLLVASPAAVAATAEVDFETSRDRSPFLGWGLAVVLVGLAVAMQPTTQFHLDMRSKLSWIRAEDPLAGLSSADTPVVHALMAKSLGSAPRVFHEPEYAGILAWELSRQSTGGVIFSDPRPDLNRTALRELHAQLLVDPSLWRGVFQQYNIQLVLLDAGRHATLAESIASAPNWDVLLEESGAVLLGRNARSTR